MTLLGTPKTVHGDVGRWTIRLDSSQDGRSDSGDGTQPADPAFFLTSVGSDGACSQDRLLGLGGDASESDLDERVDAVWSAVVAVAQDLLVNRYGIAAVRDAVSVVRVGGPVDGGVAWRVDVEPVGLCVGVTAGTFPAGGPLLVAAWVPRLCHGRWLGGEPRPENGMDGEAERCLTCGCHVEPHVQLLEVADSSWPVVVAAAVEAVNWLVEELSGCYRFRIELEVDGFLVDG